MVYRYDGPDDQETEDEDQESDQDFEFGDIPAPNDVLIADEVLMDGDGNDFDEDLQEFAYPGPSEYDIALSERDALRGNVGKEGRSWLKSAGGVLLILAALGLLMSMVGPLVFSRGDSNSETIFVTARVSEVVDGNTIVVTINNDTETVRYIGVSVGVPGEFYFRTAQLTNQNWVEGATVTLERDGDDTDDESRLLRYVYVDNIMVNAALLAGGIARYQPGPFNDRYNSELLSAETAARDAERGIWANVDEADASPT
jgi:micrococcal nuclease